jgi:hypothetical protein
LNTRAVRAERNVAKYDEELASTRQSLAKTSKELEETVKVAELLYEVLQRIGIVTDYLLNQYSMKTNDQSPASVEAMINLVEKQALAEATTKPDRKTEIYDGESSAKSNSGIAPN